MQTQSVFIAHPETTEQINALQAFMKALKITFEISKQEEYNNEFVEKLLESRQQAKQGKVTRVKKENLRGFLGL
jgi:predicted enzyme involved in methoxymalonyl-ACP biosynthesis